MKKAAFLSLCTVLAVAWVQHATQARSLQQAPPAPASSSPKYQAPPGFGVETAATPEQTGSVVAMTFDSRGRPVLSREKGPVLILEDRDNDGLFETFLPFTDTVTNCQGLCFVGNDLLAVGDGPSGTGLYRIYDRDGDSVGDQTVLLTQFYGGMGEHGPHSIFFGPDGFFYVDIGNFSGIVPTPDPLSPHRDYYEGQLLPSYFDPRGHARQIRAPGGTIFRIDPDARKWEMFAGGFRNQYDSAFNEIGELFTWDADMEWDIDLPWYRALRTVHIVPGGEYGWRTGSGKWPDYFIDSLPPIAEQGRGSPVGVEFYMHHVYPEKYRDSFILGDWSRGRILAGFLEKHGATYRETDEDFVTGEPINVTDLEVGPDGFLYFVNGGRFTAGGLYRVAYRDRTGAPQPRSSGVQAALEQPQHRSAWGRQRLIELQKRLGRRWGRDLLKTVRDRRNTPKQRVRALELLQVYGPAPGYPLLVELGKDGAWEVRAASTYYMGLHPTAQSRRELSGRLRDADPFVRRRALEALVRTGLVPFQDPGFDVTNGLLPLLDDEDRWVRYAAVKTLQRTDRNLWRNAVLGEVRPRPAIEGLLALVQTLRGTNDALYLLQKELELLKQPLSPNDLVRLLRVLHLTFINDQGVERPALHRELGQLALARFPSQQTHLNRELARTFAYLQTEGAIAKILSEMTRPETTRADQIFYAYCLRNIRSGWTEDQQNAFVRWFAGTQNERWRGGASFVGYLEAIWNTWVGHLAFPDRTRASDLLTALAPPPVLPEGRASTPFTRRADIGALSDQELAEYLVWDPMAYQRQETTDDGARLYSKAQCANCHLFRGLGYEAGPDLTNVRYRFKRKDLVEAIVFPDKTISDLWAAAEITTTDGRKLVGTILSEDPERIVLSQTGGETTIPTRDVRSREVSKKSLMPGGLLDNLTLREAVNLLLFLESAP